MARTVAGGAGRALSASGAGQRAAVVDWHGANLPISGEQLASVLGQGTLSQLGSQVGAAPADVAQQLSQLLPGLVDRLTPKARCPRAAWATAAT